MRLKDREADGPENDESSEARPDVSMEATFTVPCPSGEADACSCHCYCNEAASQPLNIT